MTGQILHGLSLSHFRSYKRLDLTFDDRSVVVFGPNGAGKTNLLEAVSLLSPGRGLRRARAGEMTRNPDNLGWRITARLRVLGQDHDVVTGVDDPGGARKVSIDDKPASQTALGRLVRVLWLVPVMDRLWLEGAGERRNFLDRIAMSFAPEHAEAVLTYEKAMRERNRLLRDQVADPSWFTALEAQLAQSGEKIIAARQFALDRLAAAQMATDTSFPRADLAILEGEQTAGITMRADLELALADGRHRDMAAGRTLIGPHRAELEATYAAKTIPARQCSTGEQKALLVSLILANARAIAEDFDAPPILLLDEVAAHLDSDRRAALYDEIVALHGQAFLSGTGAELFTDLGDRAVHYAVSETNGITQVTQA